VINSNILKSQIAKGEWGKKICNYSVNIDYFFSIFVNESRISISYFFGFLLKLNYAILITVGNMPILIFSKVKFTKGWGKRKCNYSVNIG
jgi:hypothetical protein